MRRWVTAIFVFAPVHMALGYSGPLDQIEAAPPGWSGPIFEPSFGFPTTPPASAPRPWGKWSISVRDPRAYMRSVLDYALEGQNRATLRAQDNQIRGWYHAPWMGPSANGREFISGLTRERSSRPGELGPGQTRCRQNWAVSITNPEGGFTLGRIWEPVRHGNGGPDLSGLPFPVGTVSVKFLFTEATDAEVPLLAGAPEVQAHIHHDSTPDDTACPTATVGPDNQPAPRAPAQMRLLQLDIAVRDARADETTGWVFGTFVYDGRLAGHDPWSKLQPVGLMWGNDPDLTDADAAAGRRPSEGVILSDFGLGRSFGRGGRMNGPVDNPVSSCLSCHMTAQWPNPAPMTPRGSNNWESVGCWFRNLGPTIPFGREPTPGAACGTIPANPRLLSLDYSLQLAVGRRNWEAAQRLPPLSTQAFAMDRFHARMMMLGDSEANTLRVDGIESLPISRGDDPTHP